MCQPCELNATDICEKVGYIGPADLMLDIPRSPPSRGHKSPTVDRLFCHAEEGSFLSSNIGAERLPFQRWLKFKEAYSPKFVLEAIQDCEKYPTNCIDPFGGSGTTALVCSFLGIESTTVEVNPFLSEVIRAKTSNIPAADAKSSLLKVLGAPRCSDDYLNKITSSWPVSFCEPGINGRFIFTRKVLKEILGVRAAIDTTPDPKIQSLLRICLGSLIVSLSNVVVNGKGRRYRGGWDQRYVDPEQVRHSLKFAVDRACEDLEAFSSVPRSEVIIVNGDSRRAPLEESHFDLAVFSPPYPNSFDYTDVYNLELWVLGYLTGIESNKELRRSTLQSHVQVNRPWRGTENDSPAVRTIYNALIERRSELWDRRIPEMIRAYFQDMQEVFVRLSYALRPGGRLVAVVGDSQYAGIKINVAEILIEDATKRGFSFVKANGIRSMRSSAQHGGHHDLAETALTFALA